MPKILFIQHGEETEVEVKEQTKILAAAIRNKIPIRYGCAACSCGTCAVKVSIPSEVTEMEEDEKNLLEKIQLDSSGEIRLSCRTKVLSKDLTVDLDFQDTYSPEAIGLQIPKE